MAPNKPVVAPCSASAAPAAVAAFMHVRSRYFSDFVKAYCGQLQSRGSSGWSVLSCIYRCRSCSAMFAC